MMLSLGTSDAHRPGLYSDTIVLSQAQLGETFLNSLILFVFLISLRFRKEGARQRGRTLERRVSAF